MEATGRRSRLSSAAPKFIKKINETESRKPCAPITRPSRLHPSQGLLASRPGIGSTCWIGDHSSRRPVRLLQPDFPSDQQFLTGDPAGIFGRQEESSFCNIFRRAHASQRSARNCQLLKTVLVLWQRKHTLGLCCAGRKRIDTDFPRCQFQGQRAKSHLPLLWW